ncbi:hypothetical protein [Kribbella shirazensis]|uniref:SMI1/KNR4 family protein n=1 Tax=Kribbella shirazensis TaxID=1105143 RepID=A0A7X5V6W0_9ACTN|nr:hypothetical protein [Kribbella shirazensis]NIK55042.1 hypothetical protein [Kribbella shirazensis]
MTAAPDTGVGLRAAERLARLGTTEIQPGLSETELARVEQRFGFEFADDHRAFLTAGLPVWTTGHDDDPDKASWGWPDWRTADSDTLRAQVEWPTDCVIRHVTSGGRPAGWGKRPDTLESAVAKAQRRLADVPRLIPVYAHRYLPAGRGTAGRPVISVHHLTDMMVYGLDLEDYLLHEFHGPQTPIPFWQDYL